MQIQMKYNHLSRQFDWMTSLLQFLPFFSSNGLSKQMQSTLFEGCLKFTVKTKECWSRLFFKFHRTFNQVVNSKITYINLLMYFFIWESTNLSLKTLGTSDPIISDYSRTTLSVNAKKTKKHCECFYTYFTVLSCFPRKTQVIT